MVKVCPACHRKLTESDFYRKENRLQYLCKECQRERDRKYRERNRERIRAVDREYYRQHREPIMKKVKIEQHKRRQRAAFLLSDFTEEQWQHALKSFGYRCAYCRAKTTLSRDHVIPVSKGGAYTRTNIVPACIHCNSSKGNKNMRSWYKSQVFYNPKRLAKIERYLESEANFGTV